MKTKPFDLEAAKAGAEVVTADGRSVRILDYEAKSVYPITALVMVCEKYEELTSYTRRGNNNLNCEDLRLDLRMGDPGNWITVYDKRDGLGGYGVDRHASEFDARQYKENHPDETVAVIDLSDFG